MSSPKKNLKELLKAGGYDGDDSAAAAAEMAGYAPNLHECSQPVLRRIKALKANQLEGIQLEAAFYQRVHELEKEFQPYFDAVQNKRRAIVTGEHEPSDEECSKQPLLADVPREELEKLEAEAPVEGGKPSRGVPHFWYHVLANCSQVAETIHEYDVPILKALTDITAEVHTDPATGFTLTFHFAENPYFTNATLKKYYELKLTPDDTEPFDYEGPTVVSSKGEAIDWKEGKNVTVKVVKKKQKKGGGAGRFITKTVPNESFFRFFDVEPKVMSEDLDPESEEKLREDFELGQLLRDQIIPRAVLYFTGEAAQEYDDYDDEDEDEEESGDDGMDGGPSSGDDD